MRILPMTNELTLADIKGLKITKTFNEAVTAIAGDKKHTKIAEFSGNGETFGVYAVSTLKDETGRDLSFDIGNKYSASTYPVDQVFVDLEVYKRLESTNEKKLIQIIDYYDEVVVFAYMLYFNMYKRGDNSMANADIKAKTSILTTGKITNKSLQAVMKSYLVKNNKGSFKSIKKNVGVTVTGGLMFGMFSKNDINNETLQKLCIENYAGETAKKGKKGKKEKIDLSEVTV